MTTPDWKLETKVLREENKNKEKEIQLLTQNLLNITNSAGAMNNELRRMIDVCERLAFENKDLKDRFEKTVEILGSEAVTNKDQAVMAVLTAPTKPIPEDKP